MSNLRLTLRTLLAYLDDTLDPAEVKSIGEKVADSAAAQEIIARIKKLVRKRRLTTPPFTGPGAKFDANTVAEYLDNALDSDTMTELEQFCLEKEGNADLYLAEIASCHQILTLVLGEPLMVPTTAKQRMVALVQGREAIPYRKPTTGTNTPKLTGSHHDMDLDEGSRLLGLSPRGKSRWVAWAVPAVAALLLVGAGLALYFALPQLTDEPNRPEKPNHVSTKDRDGTPVKDKDAVPPKDKDAVPPKDKDAIVPRDKDAVPPKDKDAVPPKDKDAVPPQDKDSVPPKDKDMTQPKDKDGPMTKEPLRLERPDPVSPVKAEVATYTIDRNNPTVLVQRTETGWKRLPHNSRVMSGEQLVALPGYPCTVRTDKGLNILLRGFLPQYVTQHGADVTSRLLDCSVMFHQNSKVDADLTLQRGRLHLANGAQPASVILRFWKQAWLVRLAPNTEIGVDLVSYYTVQTNYLDGEEPEARLDLVVLDGKAELLVDTFQLPPMSKPPGLARYHWSNKGARMLTPLGLTAVPPFWSKEPPPSMIAQEMDKALKEQAAALTATKPLKVLIKEGLSNPNLLYRMLSIYALGALDQIPELIDQLSDEDALHVVERDEATHALRAWIGRNAEHNLALYNITTKKGLLIDKGFMQAEALNLLTLLHGLSDPREPDTGDPRNKLRRLLEHMGSTRIAIRHVAHFLLETMTAHVQGKPKFDPAAPADAREAAIKKLGDMLASGMLTPPLRPKP